MGGLGRWGCRWGLGSCGVKLALALLTEPICAVGHGVAALCCATSEDRSWVFQGYSVTGVSARMDGRAGWRCRSCGGGAPGGQQLLAQSGLGPQRKAGGLQQGSLEAC